MTANVDLDRRQQAVLVGVVGVVAAGIGLLLPTLPLRLGWRESVVFAGVLFVLAVVEFVLDDTSF
ncbi:hypothetical protein [Halorientalis brevis]|uniref:hypothetical protein n=1 Tax=Halorientalis brevis TaxID=1126241 RepID=UPI001FF871A7|nr:hypothetical protein [Halorientalis brevis]